MRMLTTATLAHRLRANSMSERDIVSEHIDTHENAPMVVRRTIMEKERDTHTQNMHSVCELRHSTRKTQIDRLNKAPFLMRQ